MKFNKPITKTIAERFSCRTYQTESIDIETLGRLNDFMASLQVGPLGNLTRFELVSATEADTKALKGLGTYGFIKGATAFIVGATPEDEHGLEDFGYQMELIILKATELGLGTCWLGGTFTKSSFAKKIALQKNEIIPAVTSLGYIAEDPRWVDGKIREAAGSDQRFPWAKLFFDSSFHPPLPKDSAGEYAVPLEMVRKAPSASNRQPWRIVKDGDLWHFFLRRSRNYRTSKYAKMLKMADLQRIDMGIAMSHFELSAREVGLTGEWQQSDPGIEIPDEMIDYSVSWTCL